MKAKVMTSNQSSFSSQSKSVKESFQPSYSSITAQSLSCDSFMRKSAREHEVTDPDPVSDHSTIEHHRQFIHDYNSTCHDDHSVQYGVQEQLINNNNSYECDSYNQNGQQQSRPMLFIRLTHHINLPPADTTNLSLTKSNSNQSNTNQSNSSVAIQSPSQYHHQGNPRAQLTFAPHQFAGTAAHMNPYPYLVTYANGQMVPIYPGMAQHFAQVQQQPQQQQQHQQQTSSGQHQHVPHVAQGGQGGNQGAQRGGVPHHVTPSPSPGLGPSHPGIPAGAGHVTPGSGPFEPRQHLPNQATGGVNAPTGGPPAQGVVPVGGTVGGIGIHPGHVPGQPSNLVPVVPVPTGPYVKRERKVALLQDPNTMETIDLEQLSGGRKSGTSSPKPAGGAVSDTSASSSGAVTPSGGQATKESTPTPGSVTSEKISPSVASNAKDGRNSKEGTPIASSLTESNNNSNKNNSSNLGNKSNFNLKQSDGSVSGTPPVGSATNSSASSVPPVALEFMTKVAQSVSEPSSKPVIINNSSNSVGGNSESNEVVTGGTPTVPSSSTGTAVPSQPTVATTPVSVPPGPINYASVVMKPVNQQQHKSPAVPGTVSASSVPVSSVPASSVSASSVSASSASASSGNSADPSVPKSVQTTSNRSTTSSTSSAPIHPQQAAKESWSNKVSGPPPSTVTSVSVPNKQQASVTVTPSINHVSKSSVLVNNEGKQQETSELNKVDDVKSSSPGSQSVTTSSGMGSKVSKVDPPSVAVSGVQPSPKVNEVVPPSKPPSASVQPSPKSVQPSLPPVPRSVQPSLPPVPKVIPKANSTGNLQSYTSDVDPSPVQVHASQSSSQSGSSGSETVPDSSDGNVSSSDESVKQTSGISCNKNKALPAIPEVSGCISSKITPALVPGDLVNDSKGSNKEVIASSDHVPVTETPNEETEHGTRIVEEGELIDEDAVIEESEPIDPALDIDRYHKDGHWRYGRDDLLLLSKLPMSRSKPPFDKDSEASMKLGSLIKDKPHDLSDRLGSRESPSGGRSENMFLPNWMASSGGYSGPPSGGGGGNRPPRMQGNRGPPYNYGGRPSQEKRKIIIAPPHTQDVQLHKVKNAWKAGMTPEELDAEEQITLKLIKEFRGNLNKITPEKYDKILDKIRTLQIDTEDRLRRVLDLVFDKAVLEPSFCVQYANLCQHLSSLAVETVNEETGEKELVKFSRLLLMKCQKDFERDIYEGIDIEGKMKAIEEETDPDKKKALQTELDEEKRQARKKSLGNIKLIGELYRLGMLKGGIMVNCMHMLINDLEDDNLECLCTLLRTIGGQLEKESELKQKHSLDPYFNRLKNVVQQKLVGPRVRFLIQDILDMRDRGWTERERQAVNKPTTIRQIHEEEAAEEQRKELEHHERNRRGENQTTRRPYGGRMSSPASIGGSSGQKTNPAELASVLTQIKLLKMNQDTSKTGDGLPTPQLNPFGNNRWALGAATNAPLPSSSQSHVGGGGGPLPSSAPFPTPSSHNQSPAHQLTSGIGSGASSGQSSSRNTSRSGSPAVTISKESKQPPNDPATGSGGRSTPSSIDTTNPG